MDDPRPQEPTVNYISGKEGNLLTTLKHTSEQLTQPQPGHLSLAKSYRFAGLTIDKFLSSNSVCCATPYRD